MAKAPVSVETIYWIILLINLGLIPATSGMAQIAAIAAALGIVYIGSEKGLLT